MALFVYPATQISTSGLATEAKQDVQISELQDINTELDNISTSLSDVATETTLNSLNNKVATEITLAALNGKVVAVDTTGKATEAKQDSIITELQSLVADVDALNARVAGSLVPSAFDFQSITYVAAGNGAGEIETVVYRTGGAAGSIVATLTLAYDASDRLSTVTKS